MLPSVEFQLAQSLPAPFHKRDFFESAALRCAVALMRPLELYSTLTKQNGDQVSVNELLLVYVSESSPVM